MLKLSMPYGDGMVLQGGKPLRICGESDGAEVTVSVQGHSVSAKVADGRWEVSLPPLDYGEGETLEVHGGGETLVLRDVAVGEVWLAGGQSNMEFMLCYDSGWQSEKEQRPKIRFFDVPEIACDENLEDADYSKFGFWRKADSEENLRYYSAVAYYFAKKVSAETGHVVGMIGCNWSGTPACTWIDPKYLRGTPGEIWLTDYASRSEGFSEEEMRDAYRKNKFASDHSNLVDATAFLYIGSSHEQQKKMMAEHPFPAPAPGQKVPPDYVHAPGRLFSSMVGRVAPYTLRGFIWYQGESDELHPDVYDSMMSALVHCWRDTWGDGELPMYMAQLTSFGIWMTGTGNAYPTLRAMQEKAADEIDGLYMASTMDAGMMWDIHPKQKRPVGERMAKLALRHTYGKEIPDAGSPGVEQAEIGSGKVTLHMSFSSGGLSNGERLGQMLSLSIDGCRVYDFYAATECGCIVLRHPEILPGRKLHIEYAQGGYCPVDIFNSEGFSVRPFIIDCE